MSHFLDGRESSHISLLNLAMMTREEKTPLQRNLQVLPKLIQFKNDLKMPCKREPDFNYDPLFICNLVAYLCFLRLLLYLGNLTRNPHYIYQSFFRQDQNQVLHKKNTVVKHDVAALCVTVHLARTATSAPSRPNLLGYYN